MNFVDKTLTTDMEESSLLPNQNLQDNAMILESGSKENSVVSRLVSNWRKLNSAESNINFFTRLLRLNISTRDIYSFVKTQASLRKVHKGLNRPMSRVAMRAKLNDACAFAMRQRRIVNKTKRDLLAATGNRKHRCRKIIKQIRTKLDKEKFAQREIDDKKVQRYAHLQSEMIKTQNSVKKPIPASIQEFQGLKAFNKPESTPESHDPPMIYDKSIVLSKEELDVLSLGPKFAVRQSLMLENFKCELEKSICKQKYNGDDSEDDSVEESSSKVQKVEESSSKCLVQSPSKSVCKQKCENYSSKIRSVSTNQISDPASQTKSDSIVDWELKRSQVVYDFKDGTLDPTKLRATDYPYNKSTFLPKPQAPNIEAMHELRKSESLRVFNETTATKSNSKLRTPIACKSNLSDSELKGLKSLQSKVANGSIIICESDKSSKLCVLSRKQYIESGNQHCKNDLKISTHDVERLQKYVNANVEWLHGIFETGSFWGHENRVISSSTDLGVQAAPLRLLLKDHKPYDLNSDKPVPSRPVVNGRAGYNCHISELLSMILGPVAKESSGAEINSTGDMLSRIQNINDKLEKGESPSVQLADDDWCDFCRNCNDPPPKPSELKNTESFIKRVTSKKINSPLHVSNNLRLKLRASQAATKLYHRCCLKPAEN